MKLLIGKVRKSVTLTDILSSLESPVLIDWGQNLRWMVDCLIFNVPHTMPAPELIKAIAEYMESSTDKSVYIYRNIPLHTEHKLEGLLLLDQLHNLEKEYGLDLVVSVQTDDEINEVIEYDLYINNKL